jgi:hypothetical protein
MVDFFLKQVVPFESGKFEVTLSAYMTAEELAVLLLKTDLSSQLSPVFGSIKKDVPQEILDAVDK